MMDHSLGFQNEAFGALATRADSGAARAAADGQRLRRCRIQSFARSTLAAKRCRPTPTIDSTYPWLAWGNRPFVSADELLKCPATSSSQMLRKYSTINRNCRSDNAPNPYNGWYPNTPMLAID